MSISNGLLAGPDSDLKNTPNRTVRLHVLMSLSHCQINDQLYASGMYSFKIFKIYQNIVLLSNVIEIADDKCQQVC